MKKLAPGTLMLVKNRFRAENVYYLAIQDNYFSGDLKFIPLVVGPSPTDYFFISRDIFSYEKRITLADLQRSGYIFVSPIFVDK